MYVTLIVSLYILDIFSDIFKVLVDAAMEEISND